MKENKSHSSIGWYSWAKFEGIDIDGAIYQFEEKPNLSSSGARWLRKPGTMVRFVGKCFTCDKPTLFYRYEPETQHKTVVDQLNDIHYTPGGGANFRLTVSDGTTEHTAAVDLFEFLIWAQADGLIDSYSAENVGEEVVILPIPDEQQNHRATAQVKRLYVWLQQLPLSTFTRALNQCPAMWSSFDQNMEPINA